MILLLNTSIGFPDFGRAYGRQFLAVNAVIGALYLLELLCSFVALRSFFFGSVAHMADCVVILAKFLTLYHLFIFFDKQSAQIFDYPLLMVYTGLRTLLRVSCKEYHAWVLKTFESDNLNMAG